MVCEMIADAVWGRKSFHNDLACWYGYEQEAAKIQELDLAKRRQGAVAEVRRIDFIRQTSLVGPQSYILERIEAFKETGVTALSVSAVGSDSMGSFVKLCKVVPWNPATWVR